MVVTGVAIGCATAQAQTPPSAPAATGAPLQLLAPLPNATAPTPSAAVETRKIEPPARIAAPPVVSAPAAAAPVAVAPPPSTTATVTLPPAQVPEPVSADLFAVKGAGAAPIVEARPAVAAATPPVAAPEIKPAPAAAPKPTAPEEGQKLTVIVAGDSIADGVWGGLYRKLLRDKRYEIVRKARNSSGFVAFDWVEELRATDELKRADAVIFLAGTNDRQSLVSQGKPRHLFGTKAWEEGYIERVTALMQSMKTQNIPLVWISLPIARKDEFNKDSRYLNNLFAQAARNSGVIYVDIWAMFADKDGQYSAYLPDTDGRNRLLRDNDGIHFTPRGYEMIADAVLEKLQKTVPAFQQAAIAPDPQPAPAKTGKAN